MPVLVPTVLAHGALSTREQPVLTIDELTARPWQDGDAPAVSMAYDDPAIQQWHARSMPLHEALAWTRSWALRWTQETGAGWAITEGDELLGRMSLRTINLAEGHAEVAYWVLPAARGRAIAPRTLQLLSRWSLHDLGLHRLELQHSTQNPASCRVATKSGYAVEGTRRRQALHIDGWHDMHLHALLVDDPHLSTATHGRAAAARPSPEPREVT